MTRYICIHGHFYQPPRENPWIEEIEQESSAYPYHDWNELITEECYVPNASSRILGSGGVIQDIVNNYASISFNFGPTLLSWIEEHNPGVYDLILKADRESLKRFSGHGSAIAQVYNHIIMPLASRRDKEMEIIWGIHDFVYRFNRIPEGMWLAETAVDIETLELLVENGIRFTILSPSQASRIKRSSTGSWETTDEEKLDIGRPYLCRLPSGRSIALFFYDHVIATDIAFGSLLSNGDTFAERMISTFSGRDDSTRLLSIATDGETYGHHHRFADMALAYALHTIETRNLARITVFGEFLEIYPPVDEVEIHENSSWSCSHGVKRWYSDCGCRTYHACLISDPGECLSLANTTPPYNPRLWNQKWRGPLREAMNKLNVSLTSQYQKEAGLFFINPVAARNEYIDLILDRSEKRFEWFINNHMVRDLSGAQIVKAFKLLEVQRNALLMYTSCGWFFDEISGIETVQVMMYACRAMHLAFDITGIDCEPSFIRTLSLAESNIPSSGRGADIYRQYVQTTVVDLAQIASFYAISSLLTRYQEKTCLYTYTISCDRHRQERVGMLSLMTGVATFRSVLTREESHLVIASIWLGDLVFIAGLGEYISEEAFAQMENDLWNAFNMRDIRAMTRSLRIHCEKTIPLRKIFPDGKRRILKSFVATTFTDMEHQFRQVCPGNVALIRAMKEIGTPHPAILDSQVQFILNADVRDCLEKQDVKSLQKATTLLLLNRVTPDNLVLCLPAANRIFRDIRNIEKNPLVFQNIRDLNSTITILKDLSLSLDLRESQNVYFSLHAQWYTGVLERAQSGDGSSHEWISEIEMLGKNLGVIYGPSSSSDTNSS